MDSPLYLCMDMLIGTLVVLFEYFYIFFFIFDADFK